MSAARLIVLTLLLSAGIMAGAQLGKIAPLIPWFTSDLGFTLVLAGWLTSAIGLFVAIGALPAGLAIERVGTRASFAASSVLLVAGGIMLALFRDPSMVLAARLVEGAGYLVLVVATPALLTSLSPARFRGATLAIWGGFVPIGFACADFLAALMLPASPQAFLLLIALGFALFAVPASLLLQHVGDAVPPDRISRSLRVTLSGTLSLPVVLLALAFGAYVVVSVGFFTFMPTFIAQTGTHLLVSAGVIALAVPVGNVLAGVLVGQDSPRSALLPAAAGFAASAIGGFAAFLSKDPLLATAGALMVAISGGVTASALFAAVPLLVPRGGSVATGIGLVAQAGGIGTLFGPPLAAWLIEGQGWAGLAWLLAATSALGFLLLAPPLFARAAARQMP